MPSDFWKVASGKAFGAMAPAARVAAEAVRNSRRFIVKAGVGSRGRLRLIDLPDGRPEQNDDGEDAKHRADRNVDAVHEGDDQRECPELLPPEEYTREQVQDAGGDEPEAEHDIEPLEDG